LEKSNSRLKEFRLIIDGMPSGRPEGIFLCFLTSKPEGEEVSQRYQVYLNSAKNVSQCCPLKEMPRTVEFGFWII
jgi:hypothetical protein